MDKNFLKSLDHCSFYFKQNEQRVLNARAFLCDAVSRYEKLPVFKEKLRELANVGLEERDYSFLGGTENTYFLNSFSGLSKVWVPHRIPEGFTDELISSFTEIEGLLTGASPALPQYRLLFRSCPVIVDSIRIILLSAEKSSQSNKQKLYKCARKLVQDYMKVTLPRDIHQNQVLDYSRGVPELESQYCPEEDLTRETTTRWISNEPASLSELARDSINLRIDHSFVKYVPLGKEAEVFYCPQSI